ncbi:MAG: hypothetical protein ABIJ23_05450 [Candidatus Magasanikbacteria bacterium]
MDKKINVLTMSFSGAIVAGLLMLLLGIFGNIGIYMGAVEMMTQWHMFFSLSFFGIVAGIIEAGIISFVVLYLFGWTYNKLLK